MLDRHGGPSYIWKCPITTEFTFRGQVPKKMSSSSQLNPIQAVHILDRDEGARRVHHGSRKDLRLFNPDEVVHANFSSYFIAGDSGVPAVEGLPRWIQITTGVESSFFPGGNFRTTTQKAGGERVGFGSDSMCRCCLGIPFSASPSRSSDHCTPAWAACWALNDFKSFQVGPMQPPSAAVPKAMSSWLPACPPTFASGSPLDPGRRPLGSSSGGQWSGRLIRRVLPATPECEGEVVQSLRAAGAGGIPDKLCPLPRR